MTNSGVKYAISAYECNATSISEYLTLNGLDYG